MRKRVARGGGCITSRGAAQVVQRVTRMVERGLSRVKGVESGQVYVAMWCKVMHGGSARRAWPARGHWRGAGECERCVERAHGTPPLLVSPGPHRAAMARTVRAEEADDAILYPYGLVALAAQAAGSASGR